MDSVNLCAREIKEFILVLLGCMVFVGLSAEVKGTVLN